MWRGQGLCNVCPSLWVVGVSSLTIMGSCSDESVVRKLKREEVLLLIVSCGYSWMNEDKTAFPNTSVGNSIKVHLLKYSTSLWCLSLSFPLPDTFYFDISYIKMHCRQDTFQVRIPAIKRLQEGGGFYSLVSDKRFSEPLTTMPHQQCCTNRMTDASEGGNVCNRSVKPGGFKGIDWIDALNEIAWS